MNRYRRLAARKN